MNWYKKITAESGESIVELIYEEWKKGSFDANVNSVIYRIYQSGLSAKASKEKIHKKIMSVVKELSSEDGEMQLWHKVLKDKPYFAKIRSSVIKLYRKKVEEIEKAKRGPIQINTPQTPSGPPGGGGGGGAGGMLM